MRTYLLPAIRLTLILTLLTGVIYPALLVAAAQLVFPEQAQGSLVTRGGRVVGSRLIGQDFRRPEYLHPRPSAAGDGYDPLNSGASNLALTNPKLVQDIQRLTAQVRAENTLPADAPVPLDAVTRSGSGLDPEISPEYAALQVPRIAAARHIAPEAVRGAIATATRGRQALVLGEERVNVLEANLALDDLPAARR